MERNLKPWKSQRATKREPWNGYLKEEFEREFKNKNKTKNENKFNTFKENNFKNKTTHDFSTQKSKKIYGADDFANGNSENDKLLAMLIEHRNKVVSMIDTYLHRQGKKVSKQTWTILEIFSIVGLRAI